MERVKKALDKFLSMIKRHGSRVICNLDHRNDIQQIGTLIGGGAGDMIFVLGKVAASLTGAGIGTAVAYKFKEAPLVVVSAATAGMIGAFASNLLAGTVLTEGIWSMRGRENHLGRFWQSVCGESFLDIWFPGKQK